MNTIVSENKWIIMSKDRTLIAKGTPRNRALVHVNNDKDKKRILTYDSKGRAEAGFKVSGFYGQHLIEGHERGSSLSEFLEAVEVVMTMTTI